MLLSLGGRFQSLCGWEQVLTKAVQFRLFKSLLYHLFVQPTYLPPSALFKPIITPSHTPVTETDYNFHKSNSTYFTDLDIARTHLVTALLRRGIRGVGQRPDEKGNTGFSFRNTSRAAGHKRQKSSAGLMAVSNAMGASGKISGMGKKTMTEEEWFAAATEPGNLLIALGAVSCHFHREIAPYARYEIWTRLLTWDRKWLYIVSHFVEAGAFQPESYALQPWKKSKAPKGGQRVGPGNGKGGRWEDLNERERMTLKRKVFASSIAKYVVKKGRLTVPPEMVLQRSSMLPPRPPGHEVLGGWQPSPSSTSPTNSTPMPSSSTQSPSSSPWSQSGEPENMVLEESLFPASPVVGDDEWTWQKVEEERLKGLEFAEAYDKLEGLKDVFDGGVDGSMGLYSDLAFGW
jgi:hypothetical protein